MTIAGSDSCSGAGIQADLKVFSLLGVHGLTAVSTVVAETPLRVHGVHPVSPAEVQEQIRCLLNCYPVTAIKTGLLGPASNVIAVAEMLEGCDMPIIVDPVLSSSSGTTFGNDDILSAYREHLLPLATVLTPNQPEAEKLLGLRPGCQKPADLVRILASELNTAALLTGGHGTGDQAIDLLCLEGEVTSFTAPKLGLASAHGTGCTLSAALTAHLARGLMLAEAVDGAKQVVTRALKESYQWETDCSLGELRALNQLPLEILQRPPSK